MAKKSDIHVVPRGGKWAVVRECQKRAVSVHDTQAPAARRGRAVAMGDKTEYHLHGKNSQVRDRRSFGNDPHPPKG